MYSHKCTKSIHYATQQLAEPVIRLEYQLRLVQTVLQTYHSKANQPKNNGRTSQTQFTLWRNLQSGPSLQPSVINISSVQSWQRCLKQRSLRLHINNTTDNQQQQQLKQQRNSVLHAMRRKALANASAILDERAAEVERLHDGARMFRAVRLLCRRPHLQAVVHDEHGHTVEDPVEVGRRVTEYFGQQFRDDVAIGLPAFKGDNQPLHQPIEASEVNSAMKKLNNACACGYDSLPGELLKYAADQLDAPLAALFNQSLEHGQPLELGRGILILLQKPGKPIGALSSLSETNSLTYHPSQGAVIGGIGTNFQQGEFPSFSRTEWFPAW